MKLFVSHISDYKTAKISITAAYAGVDLEIVGEVPEEKLQEISPAGRLPVLETPQGYIPYTNAILRYIARLKDSENLFGSSIYEAGLVDQWLEWSLAEVEAVAAVLTYPALGVIGMPAVPAKAIETAKAKLFAALAVLEAQLSDRTFLISERISLADISLSLSLLNVFKLVLSSSDQAQFPSVTRWFLTCTNQPLFATVLGEVTLLSPAPAIQTRAPQATAAAAASTAATAAAATAGDGDGDGDGEEGAAAFTVSSGDSDGKVSAVVRSFAGAGALKPGCSPDLFRRSRVRVREVLCAGLAWEGRTVTVCGWAKTVREQGKGSFAFVALNDGSGFDVLQVMVFKDRSQGFQDVLAAGGVGASFCFTGTIVASPAKGQTIEVHASIAKVVGRVTNPGAYPLSKKRHKLETLRELAHLRPRSNLIGAVARVRNACAFATHRFFQSRGFLYVHTPLITASDCEGAGEMFAVTTLLGEDGRVAAEAKDGQGRIDFSKDFFGSRSFLTVSGQLNVECYSSALSDAYTFGPTFRAENSHTSRHLAEFWMIEPEISFADLQDDMNLAEDYLKYCVRFVMDHCPDDLAFFDKQVEKGLLDRLRNVLAEPFARITYTQAVELLMQPEHQAAGAFEEQVSWGIDLASEHERYLTEVVFRKPTIVTDYPKDIKAFYMKMNPDGRTVAAMDVLVPRIGELMGGSQREEDLGKLEARLAQLNLDPKHFSWYTDLRRYGSVPHAGFGLGFERLVMFTTGVENIRDVIPFPRYPGHAEY